MEKNFILNLRLSEENSIPKEKTIQLPNDNVSLNSIIPNITDLFFNKENKKFDEFKNKLNFYCENLSNPLDEEKTLNELLIQNNDSIDIVIKPVEESKQVEEESRN